MSRPAQTQQLSLLPPDAAALIHLVRENLRLLADLARRYEVPGLDAAVHGPSLRRPADVAAYLGAEMADLAQEQLRVVLLDTKNAVLGTALVYQGGLNATVVRLADLFREAVRAGAAGIVLAHNHPSGSAERPTPGRGRCGPLPCGDPPARAGSPTTRLDGDGGRRACAPEPRRTGRGGREESGRPSWALSTRRVGPSPFPSGAAPEAAAAPPRG